MSRKRIKKGRLVLVFTMLGGLIAYYLFMPVVDVVYTGSGEGMVDMEGLEGERLYRLDSEALRREILKDRRIGAVRLFRFPWGMLVIHTVLRKPVVLYMDKKGEMFGVDRSGVIFPVEGVDSLPVIRGESKHINLGISLVKVIKGVDEIYITEEGPITSINGYRILWGRSKYMEKAEKVKWLIESGLPSGEFDLRFGDLIIYREEVKGGK